MRRVRSFLPVWFMLPAAVTVTLFFVIPVFMTFVFSFTTMTSATGILGNRYVVSEATLRTLGERGLDPALVQKLGTEVFAFDEAGLAALRQSGLKTAVVSTIMNREFRTADDFRAGLASIGVEVADDVFDRLLDVTNTSWRWTTSNYSELLASKFTVKILLNTVFYVFFTLLFNVGAGLMLALVTFYMPSRQSKFFRAVWLIPRISPSVIYVMLWKWFTFDGGFMTYITGFLGVEPKNWLNEFPWTFVIFANGFVGASMGMIIFSSALLAIPADVLHAAEVDGANRWQQVRRIILPLMAWPILFVTSYQTLSLLTSFEYILLLTDGGPGFFTTETWALNAYHTALSNYFGNLRYGFGAALAMVLVVVGIAVSLLYLRLFDFKKLVAEPVIEG